MNRDLLDRHRSLRILVGLVNALIALFLLGAIWSFITNIADILLLFFLAWIVTFILDPVASFLIRRRFPRVVAVAVVYLALLIVISGVIVLTLPALQAQVTQLADEIRGALSPDQLALYNNNLVVFLQRLGFDHQAAENFVNQALQEIPTRADVLTTQAVNLVTGLVTSVLSILFNASLVLIISFYMLLDGGHLTDQAIKRLPPAWIPEARRLEYHINTIFGGFFRGQIIVAAIYGAMTYLVLLLLGQPNGLLASVLAGLIMILPFIGAFLAVVPPVLLVILQTPSDQLLGKLIVCVVVLVVMQQIALNLIAPRVFGQTLGVNPLLLFAGLLVGAKFGGVWGAFFAGPIIAVIYAMLVTAYERFAATSPLFQLAPASTDSPPAATPNDADSKPRDDVPTEVKAAVSPPRDGAKS